VSRALLLVLTFLIAIGGGALSAAYAVQNWSLWFGKVQGVWRTASQFGLAGAAPHVRAAAFDSACTYLVEGKPLLARLLTFRAETLDGRLLQAAPLLPSSLHSDQMVFEPERFELRFGSAASPGNWLAVRTGEPYQIVLTAYDLAIASSELGANVALPSIRKLGCADV
jgi:hypothetical protein